MTSQKSFSDKPVSIPRKLFFVTIRKSLGITGIYSLLLLIFLPLATIYRALMFTRLRREIEPYHRFSDTHNYTVPDYGFYDYVCESFYDFYSGRYMSVGRSMPTFSPFNFNFLFLLICLFCVFAALFAFRFLHNKKATDLYHALPVSRTALFFSKYLAGLSIVLIPLGFMMGINALLQAVLFPATPGSPILGSPIFMNHFSEMTLLFLMLISLYTMTVFIAINTGTVTDAVVTLLALNVSWVILVSVSHTLLTHMLIGFSRSFAVYVYSIFSPLSTLFNPGQLSSTDAYLGHVVTFITVSSLAGLGAVLFYKKRKSDHSGRAFSHPCIKHIIRIITSVAAGLSLATGLSMQQATSGSAVIAFAGGFIVASFTAYLFMYVISARGLKGFAKSLIVYGVSVIAIAAIYCAVGFDVFGYHTAVPNASQIRSVTASGSLPAFHSMYMHDHFGHKTYYDEESIEAFVALHAEIATWIDSIRTPFVLRRTTEYWHYQSRSHPRGRTHVGSLHHGHNDNPQRRLDSANVPGAKYTFDHAIMLEYRLANGLRLMRSFQISRAPFDVRYQIRKIYDLQEHRELHNPLFQIEASQFVEFEIMDDFTDAITSVSKEQADKILEALREEARANPGFDAVPYRNPVASFLIRNYLRTSRFSPHYSVQTGHFDGEFGGFQDWHYFDHYLYPPYTFRFSIYPNYTNTIKLIEEFTGKSLTAFPEGTKAVVTRMLPRGSYWQHFNFNLADTYQDLFFDIVSDTDKLQELRDRSVKYTFIEFMPNGDFLQFYFPDGTKSRLFYLWLPDIPDFYYALNFRRMEHDEIRPFLSFMRVSVHPEIDFCDPETESRGYRIITSQ